MGPKYMEDPVHLRSLYTVENMDQNEPNSLIVCGRTNRGNTIFKTFYHIRLFVNRIQHLPALEWVLMTKKLKNVAMKLV